MLQTPETDDRDSSVRAICPHPRGGQVITMGFPGLETDLRGQALISPERMEVTLDHAVSAGMALLLILPQPDELPTDAMSLLRGALRARGLRGVRLPILDYSIPGASFLRAWHRLSPAFAAIFASGGSVGMCCHHGAGRSGLVAAMHLIEEGLTPIEAVTQLRRQFPESVENDLQSAWLVDFAKPPRADCP